MVVVVKRKCRCCGKLFVFRNSGHIYCSNECREEFHRLLCCKEVFKLSEEERELRLRLLEKFGGGK